MSDFIEKFEKEFEEYYKYVVWYKKKDEVDLKSKVV